MSTIEPPPAAARAPYRRFAIFLMVGGGLLVLLSLCSALSYIVTPFMQPQLGLQSNTAVLSIGAAGAIFGALLLWIGLSFRRSASSPAFRLPSPLVLFGAFVAALVLGQLVLTSGIGAAFLFPPLHIAASLLIPLMVLSFASRRLQAVSLRSMLAQFSWGGLVTITVALLLEVVIGLVLAILVLAAAALIMGADRAAELASALQATAWDMGQVMSLLSTEPLILVFAAVTLTGFLVLVVPILEEIIKSGGPAILISRRRRDLETPFKCEVVLWGLAAGAGYAFTENMFNAQGSIGNGEGIVGFWASAMLLRAGTSLMHMVATATVAAGWYYWIVNRNRSRFFLLLALATLAHATWNTGALVLGSVAVFTGLNENLAVLSGCIVGLALIFLIGLFVAFLYWLVRLIRWGQPPPVEIITSSGTLLEIKG